MRRQMSQCEVIGPSAAGDFHERDNVLIALADTRVRAGLHLGDDLLAFFDERRHELRLVDRLYDLALAEDHAAPLAAGNAEAGHLRFARSLDAAPHHREGA